MAGKQKKPRKSLVSIADVIRAGERMSTEHGGVRRYLTPEMEISVSALPATHQGGDFYGIIVLGNGRTALFIGDVAGHDFSSSIPATEAVNFFDENQEKLLHPHLFLKDLNNYMFPLLSSVGRFITAAVCVWDVNNHVLSYASAGHPPAVLVSDSGAAVHQVGERMLPVGFERDLSFKLVRKDLLPGDRMLLYTDGLSSGRDSEGEEFGIERIEELMRNSGPDTTAAVNAIKKSLEDFCCDLKEKDDCTIICAARTEQPEYSTNTG